MPLMMSLITLIPPTPSPTGGGRGGGYALRVVRFGARSVESAFQRRNVGMRENGVSGPPYYSWRQQSYETRLFKMAVGSQGFEDAISFHKQEADCVAQRPVFVQTLL